MHTETAALQFKAVIALAKCARQYSRNHLDEDLFGGGCVRSLGGSKNLISNCMFITINVGISILCNKEYSCVKTFLLLIERKLLEAIQS